MKYNRASQTITCTTSGGPATDVTCNWFKDNEKITVTSSGGLYKHSQVISNTTSVTYENRLRIVDKSSKVAGTYTCEVTNPIGSTNGSLRIQGNNIGIAILSLSYLRLNTYKRVIFL